MASYDKMKYFVKFYSRLLMVISFQWRMWSIRSWWTAWYLSAQLWVSQSNQQRRPHFQWFSWPNDLTNDEKVYCPATPPWLELASGASLSYTSISMRVADVRVYISSDDLFSFVYILYVLTLFGCRFSLSRFLNGLGSAVWISLALAPWKRILDTTKAKIQ